MKYTIIAPMRHWAAWKNGAGFFYSHKIEFETDETSPENVKYWGIVTAMQKGFQVDNGNIFVLDSTGEYVYPAGLSGWI